MELSSIDLKVMYCKDLKGFNFFQKLTVYALVSIISDDPNKKLEQKQQHRTPTDKEGDGNPEWSHEMRFDLKGISVLDSDHLFFQFELRHEGGIFGDKNIGEVRVPCKNLIQEYNGGFKFVNYEVRSTDGKPNGVLCFSYKLNGKTTALGTNYPVGEATGFSIAQHHRPYTFETLYPQVQSSTVEVLSIRPPASEILYPPTSVHSSTPEVLPQTSEILYPSLDVNSSTSQVPFPVHTSPCQHLPPQENYYPPPDAYYAPPPPPPPVFAHPYLPPPPPPPPPVPHGAFYHPPPPSHFQGWSPEPHMGFYGPPPGHLPAFENGGTSASHYPAWRDHHSS